MNNKKRNILKLLIYIGIALILVGGSSFAYLTFFIEGQETNLVKSGCLQIDFSENNSLNLTNEVPKTDEEGKNGPNYTYTITNSCNLEAYYETTFNILQTSNSENDGKIKLYLTGDNYFEPSFVNSFKIVELADKTSDIKTSYLIDSGYLKQGEVKNFNLRMWIDYDVTSFDGSFDSRIIVTSIADKGPSFDEKTTGYQVLGKTGVSSSTLVNPDYSKISEETNQTSGLYKIQGIDDNYTYYFRGNPNNYFKFGKYSENTSVTYKDKNNANVTVTHQKDDDILWRIVRINEDGSLRLILDDFIGTSVFNNSLNTNYYSNSTIKEMIDNWYNINLKNDYEKYLTNTNFCINKTYKMVNNVNYYPTYTRNITNHDPNLKCSESDLYISKIGLLSGDELSLAGNLYNTKSANNYLYKDTNGWYTLSPASLPNNELTNIVSKEGSSLDIEKVNTELSVRPVISIGSNYILKGNGTRENPYIINSEFKKTNKLTIELDGGKYGDRTSAVFNLIAGEKLNLEIPVKDGYELSSWTLESGEGSSINGNTFVMGTTDALIKANWEVSGKILTLNLDGGTYSGETSMRVRKNSTVTLQVPSKTNYTFAGWDVSGTDLTTGGNTITMGSTDATAKAKWVQTVKVYNYNRSYYTYNAIPGSYKLEVWGAQGGNYSSSYVGGRGGYATGVLTTSTNLNLYVYVGGQPATSTTNRSVVAGGYNGGGNGYNRDYNSTYTYGQGGGGATDIRIGNASSLYARVIVAGGGSGSTNRTSGYAGGGVTGSTGTSGYGGTATSAGTNGSFGIGGSVTTKGNNYKYGSAGGGGGWYGGGASTSYSDSTVYDKYSGGGSGYVYTSSTASQCPSGCLLNSSYYLTSTSMTSGSRSGNGYATITVVSINY